jgi:lipoprotein-anchoring transpeptidase ErfK/SrfK
MWKRGWKEIPTDLTITEADKKGTVHSRALNNSATGQPAEMPYAILIWRQKGIYIHEWPQLPASHGCIHVLPGDAKKVYGIVGK